MKNINEIVEVIDDLIEQKDQMLNGCSEDEEISFYQGGIEALEELKDKILAL